MRSLGICEVKTTSQIPDEPYDSWVTQLYWQMGLAKLAYPEANIRGTILAVDLNTGDIREFNGFTPSEVIFDMLIDKAHNIWAAVNGESTPDCEPSLLCGFCEFREDCPVFNRDNLPEDVWKTVHLFAQLKEQRDELETKLEPLKESILKYIGTNKFSATNSDLGLTVTVMAPRLAEFVDNKRLKEELPDIFEQYKQIREYPASLRVYHKKTKSNGGE
ncbi:MAG: hypothetical protein AB7D38_12320 [Sulfurimonas sp.]|uniref:hypothetical protein n=1 Tax=Sulfurimonas sp. TaxID=2022749 RepID=UPI003D0F566A